MSVTPIIMRLSSGYDLVGVLDDSAPARDLVTLLPIEVELTDYADEEKIASLPRRLKGVASAAGYQPSAGDLTYYDPWGNLAIFYRPHAFTHGLIRLGELLEGTVEFHGPDSLSARIELS